jgi:prepilin signal peptidase PulO-like enzyme (type II secretory pathway)
MNLTPSSSSSTLPLFQFRPHGSDCQTGPKRIRRIAEITGRQKATTRKGLALWEPQPACAALQRNKHALRTPLVSFSHCHFSAAVIALLLVSSVRSVALRGGRQRCVIAPVVLPLIFSSHDAPVLTFFIPLTWPSLACNENSHGHATEC